MSPNFPKLISSIMFLVGLGSASSWAQQIDHLSMSMDFKDSLVYIDANYHSISDEKTNSIYFLLNPGYELDTIISKGLESYHVTQKEGIPLPFWQLTFDEVIDVNDELIVDFKYKINLNQQNHMKSNWIELNADKLWFPNLDNLNNELTYDVSIANFPESYHLITHTDAEVTRDKNKILISKDTPWYEVLILAGNKMREWKYDSDITIIGSDIIADTTIQSIGEKVKKSIDFLNSTFGMSDPITSFQVVLRNTSRKELGFQFNRRDMIVTGTEFDDYGNLSHEIGHFWWSRANFIDEPWMNESFANYSMYLVLREFDKEGFNKLLSRNRVTVEKAIPVSKASLFAPDSYISYYHKGAIHLMSLEEKIGTEMMAKLLYTCIEKKISTTESFLQELEIMTGKDQRTYFEGLLEK